MSLIRRELQLPADLRRIKAAVQAHSFVAVRVGRDGKQTLELDGSSCPIARRGSFVASLVRAVHVRAAWRFEGQFGGPTPARRWPPSNAVRASAGTRQHKMAKI